MKLAIPRCLLLMAVCLALSGPPALAQINAPDKMDTTVTASPETLTVPVGMREELRVFASAPGTSETTDVSAAEGTSLESHSEHFIASKDTDYNRILVSGLYVGEGTLLVHVGDRTCTVRVVVTNGD